jgi:hypothetical protein
VIGNADRLEVVGCIKLSAVATPGGGFKYAVYLAETTGRKPQRHDLSNSHHDVPTDDLNSLRRKGFVETLLLRLRVEFTQRTRLVMLEEYRQQKGVVRVGVPLAVGTGGGVGVCALAERPKFKTAAIAASAKNDRFGRNGRFAWPITFSRFCNACHV